MKVALHRGFRGRPSPGDHESPLPVRLGVRAQWGVPRDRQEARGIPMSERPTELTREAACRILGVGPKNLRTLWHRYAALLGGDKPPKRLTPKLLDILREIFELRAQGKSEAEIFASLAARTPDGAKAARETAAAQHIQGVEERLEEIAQRLASNESRREHDHDRLVTSLMRTQQELNHLRYEVAASVPRKERHVGFVSRVFGPRQRHRAG